MAARFWRLSLQKTRVCIIKHGQYCRFDIRNYARGTWRGLRDVMTDEEDQSQWKDASARDPRKNPYVPYEHEDPIHRSMTSASRSRPVKVKKNTLIRPPPSEDKQSQKFTQKTQTNLPSYEKLDDGDKRFGQVILSAKSKKEREKKNVILLEGYRLIQDALESGATAKCVYFSDKALLEKLAFVEDIPLYKVQYRHLKVWSDTQTPAGILAIFEKPKTGECPNPLTSPLPVTLVCDNIRDPGNMGTLIRTAAAVGCHTVLTTKGCVDVWEPKVLRAGMGSHFHIPILSGIPWEILQNYIPDKSQVLVAEKESYRYRSHNSSLNPEKLDQLTDTRRDVENLRDKVDFVQEKYAAFSEGRDLDIDSSYLNKDHVRQYRQVPLQCVQYDNVACAEDHVVLVIGGETTGVSPEARKFAFDNFGQYVTLPMTPVVNSLNSAIAASVILYEVRRHLVLKQ